MASDSIVIAVIRAARPSFRNDHDKVAFAVHAFFISSGFALTATGPPAFSESALSSPSTDEVSHEHWNEAEDEYSFVYVKPEKGSKKVLVKCLVLHDKLMVDALADGASTPIHLEINVADYVAQNSDNNYSSQFKNLDKLVSSLNSEILSKLDGSTGTGSSSNRQSSETSERSRTFIPEHLESAGPQGTPPGIASPPMFPFGGSDLFPGPGAGMYPPRSGFGGGSMLVGPDHPLFAGTGIHRGPHGGGLPNVPPGARFDPYGPPDVPGFEPDRFIRNPRRPGGRTHPDLEPFRDDSDFI